MKTRQLDYWSGEFGDAYIDRNDGQLHALRRPFFEAALDHASGASSVLEVGCNVAWNLKILRDIKPELSLAGVEPNRRALGLARERHPWLDVREGSAFSLPFDDASFDLVMTVGVLIHVAPVHLRSALLEMHRVARKYLLTVEYFSPEPVSVPYRGLTDALFKCDWHQAWSENVSGLSVEWMGDLHTEQGFDHCRFWLLSRE